MLFTSSRISQQNESLAVLVCRKADRRRRRLGTLVEIIIAIIETIITSAVRAAQIRIEIAIM